MSIRFGQTRFLAMAALLSVSGCVVGPNYEVPPTQVLGHWRISEAELEASIDEGVPPAPSPWWHQFNDPILAALIDRALGSNFDAQEAVGRIRESRSRLQVVAGQRLPLVDFTGGYRRRRVSENIQPPPFPPTSFDEFSTGFDAGWELDLFGRVRRGAQAAADEIQASEADYADVQRCLAAEVALAYIEIRTLQRRLAIVRENLRQQREVLDRVRKIHKEGEASLYTLSLIERTVHQTAAREPELEGQMQAAKNRLSVLLGEYPGMVDHRLGHTGQIPAFHGVVPVGHPAELLYRRPDVRRSERELAAASARIGVAVADFYPRVSLTGIITVESADLGSLLSTESIALTAGPSLRWNVLNFGRLQGNVDVRQAQYEQAKSRFYGVVLQAAEEVQTAMSLYAQERKRAAEFASAARDAATVSRTAQLSFDEADDQDEGTEAFKVADALREKVNLEDSHAASLGMAAANLVRLYKALAGEWGTGNFAPVKPSAGTGS